LLVIVRWEVETGWGYVAVRRGRSSRLAGFVHITDPSPSAVRAALRDECGALWVHVHQPVPGLYEAVVVIADLAPGGLG